MRCKNCGFENDDERYICQNCGSPLYDENEEFDDGEYSESENGGDYGADEKSKNKKSIIIIVVLAVVLVAMITGLIIALSSGSGKKEPESGNSLLQTSDEASAASSSTRPTTERTTEPTTKPTTESTTQESTTEEPETQSTAAQYRISADIDGDGTVTGDGVYEQGKKAELTAIPDPGAQFVGWYDNSTGTLVASGSKYTVTVLKDQSLTARFRPLAQEEPSDNDPAEEDLNAQ